MALMPFRVQRIYWGVRFVSNAAHRRPSPSFIDQNLAEPFRNAWSNAKFVGRLALFSLAGVSLATATAYQGMHIWIENVGLAAEPVDEDIHKWQWDIQPGKWTDARGGTDPGLGFGGRHLCRLAYLAQRWNAKDEFIVVESLDGGLSTLPTDLLQLQRLLGSAITIAENKVHKLHPQTLPHLLLKRAAVFERIGGPGFLAQAKESYETAWNSLENQDILAAHVAWKLGELSNRLGKDEESLSWWSQALQLCDDSATDPLKPVPDRLPTSPFAQRVLAATLVSLSRFYATHNRLGDALETEQAALALLSQAPIQDSTPCQELHRTTLLQRASVLALHQGEVLYQMRSNTQVAVDKLTTAARFAEQCVGNLSNNVPDAVDQLRSEYTRAYLGEPAGLLLRNSCRTAAIAWSLIAVLQQQVKRPDYKLVVESYARALHWAQSDGKPADYILQTEWENMVDSYSKAKART